MTQETITKPKDPDMLDPDHDDAEQIREGKVWGSLCIARNLNSDMIVTTAHTDTAYVWIIDRTLGGFS